MGCGPSVYLTELLRRYSLTRCLWSSEQHFLRETGSRIIYMGRGPLRGLPLCSEINFLSQSGWLQALTVLNVLLRHIYCSKAYAR